MTDNKKPEVKSIHPASQSKIDLPVPAVEQSKIQSVNPKVTATQTPVTLQKQQVIRRKPSPLQSMAAAGTSAVITVSFIHPIDVIKTRLQISGEAGRQTQQYKGIFSAVKIIAKERGVKSFYKGITAAYFREAVYTSIRIGLYEHCRALVGADNKNASFAGVRKFFAGGMSGFLGSIAGNPFDVLKTRMMASEGKQQLSLWTHSCEIMKGQGFWGFYRGIDSNVLRAIILNATKMGVYDTTKTFLKKKAGLKDGTNLTFWSSVVAGFFMAITVTPFDMLRTRLMNQPKDNKIYSNVIDCVVKVVKKEGPKALYKGFIPVWARFAPTTTLQLVIFENIRHFLGWSSL